MTFILLPGVVSIHGTDSVSMKREASAPSDAASAMVSSNVVRLPEPTRRRRGGPRDLMRSTVLLPGNFKGTVRRVIQMTAIVRRRSSAAVFAGDPECGGLLS